MNSGKLQKAHPPRFWWLCLLGIGAFLLLHFTAIVASEISGETRVSSAYLRPLFVQNWNLFAPNPVASDIRVFVRGTYVEAEQEQTTAWIDQLDPPLSDMQRNHFSSVALAETAQWVAAISLVNRVSRAAPSDLQQETIADFRNSPESKPSALVALEAAGRSMLKAQFPTLSFRYVQVAISVGPEDGSPASYPKVSADKRWSGTLVFDRSPLQN